MTPCYWNALQYLAAVYGGLQSTAPQKFKRILNLPSNKSSLCFFKNKYHSTLQKTRFLLPKNVSQKERAFSCDVNALQKAAKCLRFFLEQLQRAVSRRGFGRGIWGAEGKGKSSSCCCSTEPLPLPFFESALFGVR